MEKESSWSTDLRQAAGYHLVAFPPRQVTRILIKFKNLVSMYLYTNWQTLTQKQTRLFKVAAGEEEN